MRFGGRPVLESAKLVDWHVSYSESDGFGYSDAVGCPVFSAAAAFSFCAACARTRSSSGSDESNDAPLPQLPSSGGMTLETTGANRVSRWSRSWWWW